MNSRKCVLMSAALALAGGVLFGQETDMTSYLQVTNVTMVQDAATQNVIVRYSLDNAGEPAIVRLDIVTNDVSIGAENIRTLSGDVTTGNDPVGSGAGDRKIVWNARADWHGHLISNAQAHVMAFYTNLSSVANAPGVYLVVDVSEGPAAASYPVSYTFQAPDPLTDASCCSDKIYLKRIEPGSFLMGTPTNEIGYKGCTLYDSQHKVTFEKAFFAGVFETTRKQYKLVMDQDPAGYAATCPCHALVNVTYAALRGSTNASAALNINWPATGTNVSAASFFGVLRQKTGLAFDLPTEAQWEYACRAGTEGECWYDGSAVTSLVTDARLDTLGWYKANTNAIAQVGQLKPNAWGLYDMAGNAAEWCLDWGSYYTDYTGGTLWRSGPRGYDGDASSKDGRRILRGGSFMHDSLYCRSAARNATYYTGSQNFLGFRIFWTLP